MGALGHSLFLIALDLRGFCGLLFCAYKGKYLYLIVLYLEEGLHLIALYST